MAVSIWFARWKAPSSRMRKTCPATNGLFIWATMSDRGPQSAQVLDHLLKPPPDGFRRICLAGNHELMMLSISFLTEMSTDPGCARAASKLCCHTAFRRSSFPGAVCVHPNSGPRFSPMYRKAPRFSSPPSQWRGTSRLPLGPCGNSAGRFAGAADDRRPHPFTRRVLRKRTAKRKDRHSRPPDRRGSRQNRQSVRGMCDAGAYATGRLSAVRLSRDGPPRILTQSGNAVINTLLK